STAAIGAPFLTNTLHERPLGFSKYSTCLPLPPRYLPSRIPIVLRYGVKKISCMKAELKYLFCLLVLAGALTVRPSAAACPEWLGKLAYEYQLALVHGGDPKAALESKYPGIT